MSNIFLGREPIVDKEYNLYFYELLYKDNDLLDADSTRYTTASIISAVLNKFGTHSLLGGRRAFVKIDEKFLLDDLILSIPKDFFIFSLLESIEMSDEVVQRVKLLKKEGYLLSIDNVVLTQESFEKYEVIFNELFYFKIKLREFGISVMEMIHKLQENDIYVIAVGVDTQEVFKKAKDMDIELFQGYFFAEPKILENATYEPSQAKVLALYNLLLQDVSIKEITDAFEDAHEITLQLLRFINSGAFHFKNKISSIQHILTLMGRKPLAKWLMLMLYSKSASKTDKVSPLMLLVKTRTELMEKIVLALKPNADKELLGEAYFVGVLSLIEVVFGVELEKILEDINISTDVELALLKEEGFLGEVYKLIKNIESFDVVLIEKFEKKYKLETGTLQQIMMQSIENVNKFENPTQE